jgi:hypothetical protein
MSAWIQRERSCSSSVITPNPLVKLNHAVAVGMATSPGAGRALVARLRGSCELRDYHLLYATRADFLRRLGGTPKPQTHTAKLSTWHGDAERRYLTNACKRSALVQHQPRPKTSNAPQRPTPANNPPLCARRTSTQWHRGLPSLRGIPGRAWTPGPTLLGGGGAGRARPTGLAPRWCRRRRQWAGVASRSGFPRGRWTSGGVVVGGQFPWLKA